MRNVFIRALTELAKEDRQIVLMTGDLGFKVFDDFRGICPDQYLNVGVAEASLIGMAAGMALEGKMPFCYSITPFLTMRPFEQIRNDICFHHANVKIVGVGGGFSYGPNGPSHHALCDVALMRVLPEMTILTPGDPHEALWAVEAAYQHTGPVYIRLGRAGEPAVHQNPLKIVIGKSILMQEGSDVAILVSGLMLKTAVDVTNLLKEQGLSVRLVSFPTVKPLDEAAIEEAFSACSYVFTLEEHTASGGFGSAVIEAALDLGLEAKKMRIIATPDKTAHHSGHQEYLQQWAGLSAPQIVETILTHIKEQCSC